MDSRGHGASALVRAAAPRGRVSLSDCKPRECADADSPEECAEVEGPDGTRCLWTECFSVATAPMCSATPVRSGCVQVAVSDDACGRCRVDEDGGEIAALSEGVGCNGLDGFRSCQSEVPSAACDGGCP